LEEKRLNLIELYAKIENNNLKINPIGTGIGWFIPREGSRQWARFPTKSCWIGHKSKGPRIDETTPFEIDQGPTATAKGGTFFDEM
jgi:hypothetical protein